MKSSKGPFRFKQFELLHDAAPMPVGTDGVLLGAWTRLTGSEQRIADIGAATGLIALMMAQRSPTAHIDAVEIDSVAVAQGRENVERTPWGSRISFIEGDFAAKITAEGQKYDLIVSNPPFFTETLRSPGEVRARARHGDTLSPTTLVRSCRSLLKPGGTLAMITPASQRENVEWEAAMARLSVARLTEVRSTPAKEPVRILWQIAATECPTEHGSLCLRDAGGNPTEEYINIVSDFYLWIK